MKRRAYTLIEMLAVITVSSALMGVGVIMLIAMLKSEGSSRHHLEFSNTLNRLDERFRADVYLTGSVETKKESNTTVLVLHETSKDVFYFLKSNEIAREEQEKGAVVHRESYVFPEEMLTVPEIKKNGKLDIVSLTIKPQATPGSKIRYPSAEIEAVLAKDLRFENVETKH